MLVFCTSIILMTGQIGTVGTRIHVQEGFTLISLEESASIQQVPATIHSSGGGSCGCHWAIHSVPPQQKI